MIRRTLLVLCAASAALIPDAAAHEVRPAYLELRQTGAETYDVLWKVPARGDDYRLGVYVRFPADTQRLSEPRGIFADGAYIERWLEEFGCESRLTAVKR